MLNYFIAVFTFLILSHFGFTQVEVKTIYPDDTPNSNCYFSYQNEQLGLTNRNGILFIDDSLKGSKIRIEDIQTGSIYQFILDADTIIMTDRIQELDEVNITPRNRKKLLEAVIQKNKERLPKNLNIKGSVYLANLNVLNSGGKKDTVLEVFTCDLIITDVFGNMKMHVKDPVKLKKGEAKDQKLFEKISAISKPEKNFEKVLLPLLNFEGFQMKKYRKFNSHLINKGERRNLIYTTTDSSSLLVDVHGKVNNYSWRKNDSTLLFCSRYYFQDSKGSNAFNVPYSNSEYSNPDNTYSNGYVSREVFMELGKSKKNIFYYFTMEKVIEDPSEFRHYKTIESFEKMYSDTKAKQLEQIPDPKIYPLKFPYSTFF